jgi:hypothetical protein
MAMRGLARIMSGSDPVKRKTYNSTSEYLAENDLSRSGGLVDYLSSRQRPEVKSAPNLSLSRYAAPDRPEYDDPRAEMAPRTAKAAGIAQGISSLINAGLTMAGRAPLKGADVGSEVLKGSYGQLAGMNKDYKNQLTDYYKSLSDVNTKNTDVGNREMESNYRFRYDDYRDSVTDARNFDKTQDERMWNLRTTQEGRDYGLATEQDRRRYDGERDARDRAFRTGMANKPDKSEGYPMDADASYDAYYEAYDRGMKRLEALETDEEEGKNSVAYQLEYNRVSGELDAIRKQIEKIPGGLEGLPSYPNRKIRRQSIETTAPVFLQALDEYARKGDKASLDATMEAMEAWVRKLGVAPQDVEEFIKDLQRVYGE